MITLKHSKTILRGLKNASYLTIGNIGSAVITFIGFIYIVRLLGPNDYGIYVTVSAFVGMFSIITLTGLNRVILREGAKDFDRMDEFIEKTAGVKSLFSFIAIVICIIGSLITPYSMQLKLYIAVFSVYLLSTSLNGYLGIIYQATEKMQYNAGLQILNSIIFVSLSITFLYMGFGLLTLFLITLFSNFFTLIINFRLTKKFIKYKFWNKIEWDKYILRAALIFSILYFTTFLATQIDLVMISLLRPLEDVGIYGVAYRITESGLMIRGVTALAFFPIFVKTFNKRVVSWNRLLKYSIAMGLGVLAIAAIISFFSSQIITFLFGEEYRESGVIFSVLIFYLATVFFSIPFSNAIQATHNEGILLKICWIAPCMNIGLNYIFLMMFGLIGIAYSTLVVYSGNAILMMTIAYKTLKAQKLIE